jgi:hypothetical protein
MDTAHLFRRKKNITGTIVHIKMQLDIRGVQYIVVIFRCNLPATVL